MTKMLARKYEIRKVACYKGVNVCPDVFKYVTLIEFLMYDGMYFKLFGTSAGEVLIIVKNKNMLSEREFCIRQNARHCNE